VAQARALLILGDGKAAGEELERAMALGVTPDAVRHLAARAALLRGDAQGALKEARATGAAPHRRASLARIEGQALGALGRYGEAAEAFERALALSPRDAAVWSDMARLEMARGNVAAALSAADRAFALAPGDADVLALRAMLARNQYGLEAAASWFEKALARAPDNVEILVDYAATLADLGRAGRALVLTRRALALSPGLPRAYLVQAIVAARAGRYDLARALLWRTGGVLDGEPATRLLRGVLHLHAGNATLASDEFAPLLAEQPLNLRVRVLLARARYDARQYAEAEKVLFPIVERDDAGSYALTLSARIHEALGDRAAAGAFLSRAAALAPGRPGVFRGAGELPRLAAGAVAELADIRARAREAAIEGVMLKRRDSAYLAGRRVGYWYKWKRDPLTADCVLMYAQRGSGKRSSYYSDYTFGAWNARPDGSAELVPVGKAYSGYTDAELLALDRWIRNNTVERFGPVRAVRPALVLEVAFDAVQRSARHRSGVAMRFPRIHRIRWDKPAEEAERLETLVGLIEN
jgi:tetratricopeptide (TPR) repeat protein